MTSTTASPLTTEANEIPALGNLTSLRNILKDIGSKMNHQILGNCGVLEAIEISRHANNGPSSHDGQPIQVNAFCKDRVDALIRNPVRLALGRISGLDRVINQLESQIKAMHSGSSPKT